MSDLIVKNLNFGQRAQNQVFKGIDKLTQAVSSTLGASGKCVLLEDDNGKPIITKDGVTVANSIVLLDPVENMGATLLKEAARKTVNEAGDGTTTATILAHAILKEVRETDLKVSARELKDGINSATKKAINYLEENSIPVKGNMIDNIATISTNNDPELGKIIGDAFRAVGKTGVVMMDYSPKSETEVELVDGIQYDKGTLNANFITNQEKKSCELDNPVVLLIESPVNNIRQIQSVLEYVIKEKKSLLIIADVEPPVMATLAMNKQKGNIKVNIINAPTYGVNKREQLDDLSMLTGATVINEDLGDDMDLIQPEMLGTCLKSTTTEKDTVIQVGEPSEEILSIITQIKDEIADGPLPSKLVGLEKRLARLSAKIAIVKVGADSDIELKEKSDRIEDAICATKAAIKEGIVSGGGIALLNAALDIKEENESEKILTKAILSPFKTILDNAGIEVKIPSKKGTGINVVTGKKVNMIKSGIIDPLLVTKSALKNAVSVATTILSTDCVINNLRHNEGDRK